MVEAGGDDDFSADDMANPCVLPRFKKDMENMI
jgi:hypothetical protein